MFRGFGGVHYGQRDFRADGSYVTTLWIVALYVPVVLLKSIRMRRTGETKFYEIPVVVSSDTAMNWNQVLSVYAWFAVEVALLVASKTFRQPWLLPPAVLLLGLPWILQRRAKERAKAETERQGVGFSAG